MRSIGGTIPVRGETAKARNVTLACAGLLGHAPPLASPSRLGLREEARDRVRRQSRRRRACHPGWRARPALRIRPGLHARLLSTLPAGSRDEAQHACAFSAGILEGVRDTA